MKSSKLLIGIFAGFAGGFLTGILLAPEKGSDMRQNIMDKSNGCAGTIKDKFSEFIDVISQKHRNVEEEMNDMMDEGKSKFSEMIVDGKNKYQEVKNESSDMVA